MMCYCTTLQVARVQSLVLRACTAGGPHKFSGIVTYPADGPRGTYPVVTVLRCARLLVLVLRVVLQVGPYRRFIRWLYCRWATSQMQNQEAAVRLDVRPEENGASNLQNLLEYAP